MDYVNDRHTGTGDHQTHTHTHTDSRHSDRHTDSGLSDKTDRHTASEMADPPWPSPSGLPGVLCWSSPFEMGEDELQRVMVGRRDVEHQTLETLHSVPVVRHLCKHTRSSQPNWGSTGGWMDGELDSDIMFSLLFQPCTGHVFFIYIYIYIYIYGNRTRTHTQTHACVRRVHAHTQYTTMPCHISLIWSSDVLLRDTSTLKPGVALGQTPITVARLQKVKSNKYFIFFNKYTLSSARSWY